MKHRIASGPARVARRSLAALLGMTLAASCAVGPNYRTPHADTPDQFAAAVAASAAGTVTLSGWWKSLKDPELDSLVERAIKSNLNLEAALTRLQQARTYESVVTGSALPTLDASGGAAKGTGSDLTRGRASQPLVSADNTSGLQHINAVGGFDTVWLLDIFGKYRREIEAARYDTQAAAAARNSVLTYLVADVVRAYIDLRGFQTQLGILHQASDVLRESLRIVTIRYERGITNELDEQLAARELDTFLAQIAPVQAQANAAQYALAVLLGDYPETVLKELAAPQLVPAVPEVVAVGLPVDLLKRRPDIQQAERELASATAHIGVATADLFPQVTLVGAFGVQTQGVGTPPVVSKNIWSFGPGAAWPLLDFGALDAQVDIATLQTHLRLVNYRQTILSAVQEVDTALDAYSAEHSRLANLGDALVAAQRALELSNQRYERGLTDFLNVVDAERQLYELQQQFADAQVSQGEQFVQLYKSLGGGWQDYQTLPPIRQPQPVIVAAFRRLFSSSTPP